MWVNSTQPDTEPITLDAAKAHVKSIPGDTSEDADILAPMISAAREFCEMRTGMILAEREVQIYPDGFAQSMRLPVEPIVRIVRITYLDADGAQQTLAASAYTLEADGTLTIPDPPEAQKDAAHPILITAECGFASLPATIRQAMLLLIGHWYNNREAVVVGSVASVEVEKTVDALLNLHKAWWF